MTSNVQGQLGHIKVVTKASALSYCDAVEQGTHDSGHVFLIRKFIEQSQPSDPWKEVVRQAISVLGGYSCMPDSATPQEAAVMLIALINAA